jgi:hypothetical protein
MPRLLVHGWWNMRGEKMSKSLGNIVDPSELADRFGVEALRYYLVRDIVTGKDSDFDVERLIMLYNTELANELGNLCNRALNMSQRFTAASSPAAASFTEDDLALQTSLAESTDAYRAAMDEFDVSKGLEALSRHVVHCNGYAERMKPWELNKDPEKKERLATVLQHLAESVAHCAVLLSPVLPDAAAKLAAQLNLPSLAETRPVRSPLGPDPGGPCDRQTQAGVSKNRAEWPQADYIVANPPFIGASRMRDALGDGYTESLRKAWKGDVPESADFVMFWWQKAAAQVVQGSCKQFGFITTNSIHQTFNRRVIERSSKAGTDLRAVRRMKSG